MSMINIVIGFDFGLKKIGIAIGQKITCSARPLMVVHSKNRGVPNWKYIEAIYHEWEPMVLVVGLPLGINGDEQPITILAKNFATQLQSKFHNSMVEMHDERFSTIEARSNNWYIKKYNNQNNSIFYKQQKNLKIHAKAAEVILNSWLNKN